MHARDLKLFDRISADFWMTLPPPLLTSTPVRREAFQSQTAAETCRAETRQLAEVRSLTSHDSVVIKTQPDRLSNSQKVLRTVSDATRSDRQNDCGTDDYKDAWSTSTPSRHLVSSAQPFSVAAYTYRTMPSMSRRGPCRLDPAKYQLPVLGEAATADVGGFDEARRSSPSVFRFDASRPPLSRRLDARTHDTEPSPIYAEPCDRLADGLRQRVAGRRARVPPTTETVTVATPPISAGYKQPRDFLDLASANTRDIQPPASLPDRRSAARSPQVVVTAPSTIDDDDNDDDEAAASTVEAGPFPDSADGRGPRSRFRYDNRLKISAAAAAVRRQRRSNYDNIDDDEDQNNDDDGGHASRCTTVSSARTEYSPPWDADRWRNIVDAADLELCMRGDVMNCAAARTGASEQPDQQQVSQLLNCCENCRTTWVLYSCRPCLLQVPTFVYYTAKAVQYKQ